MKPMISFSPARSSQALSKAGLLALPAVAAIFAHTNVHAATIVSVTTQPLSTGEYINPQGGDVENFQKPGGLIFDNLGTDQPRDTSSVHVRNDRNNAQSFTVSDAFTYGIEVTAFAIQFEKRGNDTSTFGVRLFKIDNDDLEASPFTVPDPEVFLLTANDLSLDTAASLGVTILGTNGENDTSTNGASGTMIFHLDAPLLLDPGAYVFQLLPGWSSNANYTYFDWAGRGSTGSDTIDGRQLRIDGGFPGQLIAHGGASSTNLNDYSFGIIGTAAIPEPSTAFLAMIGLTGAGLVRSRRGKC